MSVSCRPAQRFYQISQLKPVNANYRSTASTSRTKVAPPLVRHGVCYYWDTIPPTEQQLQDAQTFFTAAPPELIDSATKFRTVKETSAPEVAFLGRSNVGKSSLLNALMGEVVCHTSKKPGRTRSMNFFAIGGQGANGSSGKATLLDMPGYGYGSQVEWGTEIVKYITKRKQFRRAFVLIDPHHGMKDTDEQLLSMLRQNGISHQVVLSKIDRLISSKKKLTTQRLESQISILDAACDDIRGRVQPAFGEGPEALGELMTCCATTRVEGQFPGIRNLRWAVLAATGISCQAIT